MRLRRDLLLFGVLAAVAVVGGLITSSLLTLVVVPLAYYMIDRFQVGMRNKKMTKIHAE